MKPRRSIGLVAPMVVAAVALVAGCDRINEWLHPPPDLRFAPYGSDYAAKPDFARVEYEFPLTVAERAKLTPANLKGFDQEQIDQIYARLTAGPIPDGPFDGNLVFPMGASGDRRLAEIVGGLPGFAVELKLHRVEELGRLLWKGKVFFRDDRLLRNRIEDLTVLKPIVDNPDSVPKITVGGKDQWLLFPARLYCGQSLLDGRRESVIIDYFFSDGLPGYREKPDFLAGRHGIQVRDEIRMVRPGFYLGRAYAGRVFLLNFTLYSKDVAERDGAAFQQTGAVKEDCWPGTQARQVVATK